MKYWRFIVLGFLLLLWPAHSVRAMAATASADTFTAPLDILLNQYASKRGLTDWEALVLGVNGVPVKPPLFETDYFKRVENEVNAAGGNYRLVTDYARIALAWKSHGHDARDIAGVDFIKAIADFPDKQKQGIHALSWSLIALYGYQDQDDATIQSPLVDALKAYQRPSGGFAAALPTEARPGPPPDVDLTAMAVTALAPYQSDAAVRQAIETALDWIETQKLPSGGFLANGVENAESLSQVIVAYCAAGVSIEESGLAALDAYRLSDGTYAHVRAGISDPIATRQAALALSAVRRAQSYDALTEAERAESGMRRGVLEMTE